MLKLRIITWSLILTFAIQLIVLAEAEIGVYVGESPPSKEEINAFEDMIGRDIASVSMYQGIGDFSPLPFPSSYLEENVRYHDGYNTKTVLHITLEPWALNKINNGGYDDYFRNYAESAKQWGDEIRLRFGQEMIDDDDSSTAGWYPWQDRPEVYKSAFRRVYNIFHNDVGADNVKFIWAPNHHISDKTTLAKYYPGEEFVDWIGIDGYNFGYPTPKEPFGYWASFDDIFSDIYHTLVENPDIFGDKPIMLAEFASAEGDLKDEWIIDAFQKIMQDYPKIKSFYWFNINKERDWRIDSSPESLIAFRQAMGNAYFTSHPTNGAPPPLPTPTDIKINVRIPNVNILKVNITRVSGSNWQPDTEVRFGTLFFDSQNKIFLSSVYYVIDVGIISNNINWVITHQTSPISNGFDSLDTNINVVFVNQTSESSGEEISKVSFFYSNGLSFNKNNITNGWLRIYYGIATGAGDAPGVEPITLAKSAGNYTGKITLTLTP